ncbi:MAG: permease [Coriobacteriia bacterium]|nr:permease [Coriobacteriia bacterium]
MDPFLPIQRLAEWITFRLVGLEHGSALGEALAFFLYDVPKILILLSVVVFGVAILRSHFPPERTKRLLSHRNLYSGNVAAAGMGVLTPFCSCSSVPLFIGFVEAGVPLGVTFSFLIASPMVDVVALTLLLGLFGWRIAILYVAAGMSIAIASGIVIGKLGLEHLVEEYVYRVRVGEGEVAAPTWRQRVESATGHVKEIVGRVWPYVVGGIAIGALMHGYVPEDFLLRFAGPDNPFAVPVAALLGVPLYANVAGIIPIAQVLFGKGMALGTVLAFMMAVVALSVPEMVILRKVLKPKLIAVFVGINTLGIIVMGYLFNAVMG